MDTMGMAACAVAVCLALASPAWAGTYVVLVDASSSVGAEERAAYRESVEGVVRAVRPGDRLVVAALGGKERASWVRDFDAEAPAPTGRRFADGKRRKEFEEGALAALGGILGRAEKSPDKATRIVDAVEASSQAFSQSPDSGKTLVVLSDMLETGRFDLASGRKKDLAAPAALAGAKVYVAGAGGKDYAAVEAFWTRYFSSAPGAAVVQYGRYPVRIR